MSNTQEIRPVAQAEGERLAATITLAMAADPATRWAMSDADRYVKCLMPLVGAFGGDAAMKSGTAHVIGDFAGAAIWLRPGCTPDDEAMGDIFARHVPKPHLGEVYGLFEAMAGYHPHEPHWYLPLIGVDPAYQRQGLGSRLLERGLNACDNDGVAAYLESTSPASVRLYQRFGFEVLGEIVVGKSPPMFPMLRKPR